MARDRPASVSQDFSQWAAALGAGDVPATVRAVAGNMVLDFAGLCIAARRAAYVEAVVAAWDGEGDCTAIGHEAGLDAAGAAMVNGTAAHGEDYDDTFEGAAIHTGAVVIPAALAACERHRRSGADALRGIAAGAELMCRMALAAPTQIHRAGFHPTAVIGALGATAAAGVALGLSPKQLTDALGVAGSLSAGIIEYLAEGAWTKRLHAGWAAQCGLRAAALGRHGVLGPRTVIEGEHGFFHAFTAGAAEPDFGAITHRLGASWHVERVAFKPYACGTMAQPFIDCAIAAARDGLAAGEIDAIVCRVGEGTVHRLWEPLAEKRRPSTPYAAKFSVPFCVAVAFVDGAAGLAQFTEDKVSDPDILGLAAKVGYEIDPADEYPRNYTGHLRATLVGGAVREFRQPHLRGGAREPLSRAELGAKFHANAAFGGWPRARADALETYCAALFDAPDLSGLKAFRG